MSKDTVVFHCAIPGCGAVHSEAAEGQLRRISPSVFKGERGWMALQQTSGRQVGSDLPGLRYSAGDA